MKLKPIIFFIFGALGLQVCVLIPGIQKYLNRFYSLSVEEQEKLFLPLKTVVLSKPYRIIQIGAPRSGSTFQFQLLDAIVSLKSSAEEEITSTFLPSKNWRIFPLIRDISENKSFIVKTHFDHRIFELFQQRGHATVFASSTDIAPYAVYNQERERLVACPLCEVDRYKSMFRLSEKEVTLLKEHMDLYSSLRMCCGEQMSKYEILRLNGCDVAQYAELPDYPRCEDKNLEEIEAKFAASPIPFHANNPEVNWAKPGDCARFGQEIASGKGFNGHTLTSCEIDGKFAGTRPENATRTEKMRFDFRNATTYPPWIRKYMLFHNAAVDFRGRLREDVPYLVYQCTEDMPCGDWGDRVLGMVKALFLAMCTDRVLLIDSTSPVPLDTILNPGFIAWNVVPPESNTEVVDALNAGSPISKHSNTLGYRMGQAQVLGDENYRLSEILDSPCMAKHLLVNGWHKYKIRKSMSVPYAFHSAFWTLFTFDDEISYRAEKMKKESGLETNDDHDHHSYDQNVPDTESKVYNGLHHGYHNAKEKQAIFNCNENLSYYLDFNASAYLVSDHLNVKTRINKVDPSIHYYRNKMLGSSTINDLTTSLRNERISYIDSMAEMKVLVESECLALSNTMYAMLAYYIRGPENECHALLHQCERYDLFKNPLVISYEPGDEKPCFMKSKSKRRKCSKNLARKLKKLRLKKIIDKKLKR